MTWALCLVLLPRTIGVVDDVLAPQIGMGVRNSLNCCKHYQSTDVSFVFLVNENGRPIFLTTKIDYARLQVQFDMIEH